ncbi:MAG TPA: DUF4260 domain-containing protein [Ktedonobacterales bacterium]
MNPLTHPRWMLQAEGGALLVGSVTAYAVLARAGNLAGAWWLFGLLFLAPDLAALGYLINPRIGAACYNALHTELPPALLLGLGVYERSHLAVALALVWLAHIGLDRLLALGLKYPTKFQDTHLQHV